MEIELAGGKFTWSNNHPIFLVKLDRYLMSKNWETLFPRVQVYKLPREVSHHNPLILSTDSQMPLKHLRFQFELTWIKNPKFIEKVEEIWKDPCHDESALDKIRTKIKKFKQYFEE